MSLNLLKPPVGIGSCLRVFKAFIGCEESVAPANDKSPIVWNYALDLLPVIFLNKGIEFATVLADEDLTLERAHDESGGVLHPGMTSETALFALLLSNVPASVIVIELAVINDELSVLDLQVLVGVGTCNDY